MVCLTTQVDLNVWLWELAAIGHVFSKIARERILRVIADDGLRSYAERILPLFNHTVQACKKTYCNNQTFNKKGYLYKRFCTKIVYPNNYFCPKTRIFIN